MQLAQMLWPFLHWNISPSGISQQAGHLKGSIFFSVFFTDDPFFGGFQF